MTIFIRLVEAIDKAGSLRAALKGDASIPTFDVSCHKFRKIPGSPFSYWISEEARNAFAVHHPAETVSRRFTKGLCTTNDARFVRAWWEIGTHPDNAEKWRAFVNGGASQPFYADIPTVLNWQDGGRELKAYLDHKIGCDGQWSRWINSVEHYFRPGMMWPLRTSAFSPQALPANAIFSVRSYVGFTASEHTGALIALTSSKAFDYLTKASLGRTGHPEFVVGVIQKMPIPDLGETRDGKLDSLFREAWSILRKQDESRETSHAFFLPSFLLRPMKEDTETDLAKIRQQIDAEVFEAYGLKEEDCVMPGGYNVSSSSPADDLDEEEVEDSETIEELTALLSWCVGVAFGRFDSRFATDRASSAETLGPFDPLNQFAPGMHQESCMGRDILVDDIGHAHDLPTKIEELLATLVSDKTLLRLDLKLRKWISSVYWPIHIRMYSKSRRKAPIYWQLSTPSASYSIWLYIHAFTHDTLHRALNDFVAPRLAQERRALDALRSEVRSESATSRNKNLQAHETLVDELNTFYNELVLAAPLWDPNLNDGVVLNFAPLWRLVPHNRSWQKHLKITWNALSHGDFDWSHIAMRLWPERVIPKCSTDRSLAIAHGIENKLWFEDAEKKWKPLEDAHAIQLLVDKYTSPGVKAAVQSLNDAPDATVVTRHRRSKAA